MIANIYCHRKPSPEHSYNGTAQTKRAPEVQLEYVVWLKIISLAKPCNIRFWENNVLCFPDAFYFKQIFSVYLRGKVNYHLWTKHWWARLCRLIVCSFTSRSITDVTVVGFWPLFGALSFRQEGGPIVPFCYDSGPRGKTRGLFDGWPNFVNQEALRTYSNHPHMYIYFSLSSKV